MMSRDDLDLLHHDIEETEKDLVYCQKEAERHLELALQYSGKARGCLKDIANMKRAALAGEMSRRDVDTCTEG